MLRRPFPHCSFLALLWLTGHRCLGLLPGSPRPFCGDFCGETVNRHSPSEPHHLIQQLCCLVVTHSIIPYIILGFCQCGLVGTCLSLELKSHSYCDCPHCLGSRHCEFLRLASVSFHLAGISGAPCPLTTDEHHPALRSARIPRSPGSPRMALETSIWTLVWLMAIDVSLFLCPFTEQS